MPIATVSAAFVNHVLDVASRYDCDTDALLRQSGLHRAQLSDPIRRVPMTHLYALYDASIEASGVRHFGLQVGATVRPSSYGGLGYVAMTSATLGDALGMIRRFGKIVFDSPSSLTRTHCANGRVTLEDQRVSEQEPYSISHTEAVLVGWTAFGRWLAGKDSPLIEVHMLHDAPEYLPLYEQFFGCSVYCGSHMNGLILAEEQLQLPVLGADFRTHQSMILEAELQLGQSYAPFSFTRRLRSLMVEQLPQGELRLDALARQMAMSPRTLQRKLAAEGLSFSGMLETVRMELAEHYLGSSLLSITEIALSLGFSQASAFSHAFRQTHGMSPAEYRRRASSNAA